MIDHPICTVVMHVKLYVIKLEDLVYISHMEVKLKKKN